MRNFLCAVVMTSVVVGADQAAASDCYTGWVRLGLESLEEDGVEVEIGESRQARLDWTRGPMRLELTRNWATTSENYSCDFDRVSESQESGSK